MFPKCSKKTQTLGIDTDVSRTFTPSATILRSASFRRIAPSMFARHANAAIVLGLGPTKRSPSGRPPRSLETLDNTAAQSVSIQRRWPTRRSRGG